MVATKRLLNNFWTKNYSVHEIFFKNLKKNQVYSYLKKQHFIEYETIKKNFLIQYCEKYPVGYMLKYQNRPIGFLGTLFSIRSIQNKKKLFCNIHSWLVDINHRIASQLLFKKILNKCIITVLTARPGLTRTFKEMGFKSFQMKYRILCLINFSYFFNGKKNTSINMNKSWIFKKIKNKNIRIYNEHAHDTQRTFKSKLEIPSPFFGFFLGQFLNETLLPTLFQHYFFVFCFFICIYIYYGLADSMSQLI